MKLLDKGTNQYFNDLFLLLTKDEAIEISYKIENLLQNPKNNFIEIKGEDSKGNFTKGIIIEIENPDSHKDLASSYP